MGRRFRALASAAALAGMLAGTAAEAQRARMDPDNPTCPLSPNWSTNPRMTFTQQTIGGRTVLLAEGQIDDDLMPRLRQAIQGFNGDEIWLRSPGGNAEARAVASVKPARTVKRIDMAEGRSGR